jgi:hypothetical protein
MLNRKDLLGGVMLGTVLSCVLCVGAMTTSANAFVSAAHDAANSGGDAGQVNTTAIRSNDRSTSRN